MAEYLNDFTNTIMSLIDSIPSPTLSRLLQSMQVYVKILQTDTANRSPAPPGPLARKKMS